MTLKIKAFEKDPDLLNPDYYKPENTTFGTMQEVKIRIETTLEHLGFSKREYDVSEQEYSCFVVIKRDLIINDPQITRIPFKIHRVKGDVIINNGTLAKLTGFPNTVDGNINVSGNKLTSLASFPKNVGGGIYIQNNQIKKLTKTNGDSYFPAHINGDFNCSGNKLVSLAGGPRVVNGSYECSSNKLKNLDHSPATHSGIFDCSNNPIEDFRSLPDGSTVYSNPHKIPDYIVTSKHITIQKTKVKVVTPETLEYEAHTEEELEKGYHDED